MTILSVLVNSWLNADAAQAAEKMQMRSLAQTSLTSSSVSAPRDGCRGTKGRFDAFFGVPINKAWSLRNRPALHYPVELETQIVMQPMSGVLLKEYSLHLPRSNPPLGLRRYINFALLTAKFKAPKTHLLPQYRESGSAEIDQYPSVCLRISSCILLIV
jgi:hypothetical protein